MCNINCLNNMHYLEKNIKCRIPLPLLEVSELQLHISTYSGSRLAMVVCPKSVAFPTTKHKVYSSKITGTFNLYYVLNYLFKIFHCFDKTHVNKIKKNDIVQYNKNFSSY